MIGRSYVTSKQPAQKARSVLPALIARNVSAHSCSQDVSFTLKPCVVLDPNGVVCAGCTKPAHALIGAGTIVMDEVFGRRQASALGQSHYRYSTLQDPLRD